MAQVVYVTYQEAQKLVPFFKHTKIHGPWKEIRESSGRILRELENVRSIDYSPLRGDQIFLSDTDYEFLIDALAVVEGR